MNILTLILTDPLTNEWKNYYSFENLYCRSVQYNLNINIQAWRIEIMQYRKERGRSVSITALKCWLQVLIVWYFYSIDMPWLYHEIHYEFWNMNLTDKVIRRKYMVRVLSTISRTPCSWTMHSANHKAVL